jgi:tetratricopeptide (TPR) repeat protein
MLAALVMKCLEKDAADRPQSASDLVRVLDATTTSDQQHAMPPILLGGRQMLGRALAVYAVAFIAVAIVAKAAIVAIGLPDWVLPGALVVMALGLPVILFTGYVHYVTHRAATETPTLTPRGSRASQGTFADIAVKASPHLSWKRTTRGGVIAVTAFVLLVAAFMTLRALGIGPAGSLLAAGKLTGDNEIVVADFVMKGGDSSLANVVTEAVRTGLSESPLFTILSPATVASALQRMQLAPTTRLDSALARNVAVREGAKAYVAGEVTPFGTGFAIAMRLVSADSGTVLASFQQTANGPAELLGTIDKLTRSIRGKAGESLKKIHADPPLDQVTTSSLEALKKYVEGARAVDASRPDDGIPLLKEAIAIDTTFASAYRKLGVAYRNGGHPGVLADSALVKAYRYRDRLTERERGLLIGYYFGSGPGRDRAKGVEAYEAVLRRYPKEGIAINNLALALNTRREFSRAESLYRRAVQLDPSSQSRFGNLVEALLHEGKFRDAESVLVEFRTRFPKSATALAQQAMMVYLKGNIDSSIQMMANLRSVGTQRDKALTTWALTDAAILKGKLAESTKWLAMARQEDSVRGVPPEPLRDSLDVAFMDIWMYEQPARALSRIDAALRLHPITTPSIDRRPYFGVATLYSLAGRPDRARAMLAQYDAEYRDTTWRRVRESGRHYALAEIALAERRPADAVVEFRRADRMPDGPANGCKVCLPAALARAFDQAGMADSAIAMFEQYISTPDVSRMEFDQDPTYLAGTYKRLGELYEAKGERVKAASNYRKFVELWKDADPELQPKVVEVRRRLARLEKAEGG